ncbi:LysE family translocator [Neorhizobium galegae]|uniref:Lysine exporter protein (LYSE/YGGA) n=1 Tax=Neorhizobium galegae bv. officinalis TaxID=323656 RepID=A0A0T7GPS1_NEOGA|nr:LysE family translocator [Neorhizobium galegae]CDZ49279.1 Lysine exporter protein (LYSE/YGGA) [Neorhizobium galegae bv. officinalis]
MPEISTLIAFAAAVLVMQATPGPDMMLVLGRSVGQGRRVALCTVLGMTLLAGMVQLPLLVLGVASLIHASPVAFMLLRWVGATYLVWLGVRLIWQSVHRQAGAVEAYRVPAWSAMREGMINNLTNPKPLLFMFAFLPQFVDPSRGPVWAQLLLIGVLQKLSGVAVLSSVALVFGSVGGWLARRPGWVAWQERFTGAVLIFLGLRLMLTGDARPASA